MNLEQLWLIGGAALALFWMLGAHNRLVALRNAIMAAWAQVDEPLQRRSAAVGALAAGLREPLRDEQGALEAVMTAQAQLQAAMAAMRERPAQAPRAAALTAAEATLAPQLAALQDATQRLGFARQLFNDAVAAYNQAAQQFPTRLLSRLFGFGVAGGL